MSTEGQGSEEQTTTETETAPVETASTSQDELAQARAEIERLTGQLKATRDEAAAKRVKAREAAEKAGEFERAKQLLEEELAEARAALEELPTLREAASELGKIRAAREARIAESLAEVDEDVRAAILLIPDLDARERAASKLVATKPSQKPPGATPAPSAGPVVYRPGISSADPAAWQKLKEEHGVPAAESRRPFWARGKR